MDFYGRDFLKILDFSEDELHYMLVTAKKFKEMIEVNLNVEVILEDERLTTVQAHSYMIENNYNRNHRKKSVDSVAACIILQTYLDKMKGR